jgi:phenylalanyl-tRNA synthetase beta chain
MKLSVKLIQKLVDFPLPPVNELVDVISRQLGEVEKVIDLREKYNKAVVVQIKSYQKIEGSDHLNLCQIDDKGLIKNIKRNSAGLIQVVCGAPNVREDLITVWLQPDAIVPSTYLKENFKLSARPIMNHTSYGMLASPKELDFSEEHDGIYEFGPEQNYGCCLTDIYDLDDQIIEIENKMFTRRPDCFGLIGIAREISAILGHRFHSPSYYTISNIESYKNHKLTVNNKIPDKVLNFDFLLIDDLEIRPSPNWLKFNLIKLGLRPVNNLVDLTNWVMYLTSQPIHAYDFSLIESDGRADFVIRQAHDQEKLSLINGKQLQLSNQDIVIASKTRALGLAGVMGGLESQIANNTKASVIELANFDYGSIRLTAKKHGITSEAVTRFTKQQNPDQILAVRQTFIMFLRQIIPNAKLIDEVVPSSPRQISKPLIKVSHKQIETILGFKMEIDDLLQILNSAELKTNSSKDSLEVEIPFWRTDLSVAEDIIEEISRIYGYDKLPKNILSRTVKPAKLNLNLEIRQKIRRILSSSGANELLTYSFVSTKLLNSLNLDEKSAYKINNALSPELNFYRLNIIGGLLDKVYLNHRAGYDKFVFYEFGQVFDKSFGLSEKLGNVPNFVNRLAVVYSSNLKDKDDSFYQIKYYFKYLLSFFGLDQNVQLKLNCHDKYWQNQAKSYQKGRLAYIYYDDECCGLIGSINNLTAKAFKLPTHVAAFEINLSLFTRYKLITSYQKISKYPSVNRDLCFEVDKNMTYIELFSAFKTVLEDHLKDDYLFSIQPLDIYQPSKTSYKRVTFHFEISHKSRTLNDQDVNQIIDNLVGRLLLRIQFKLI